MQDQIVKSYKKPIKACCQFTYKGYQISASTLININRIEVAVFESYESNKCLFESFDVESAIEYVNHMTTKD